MITAAEERAVYSECGCSQSARGKESFVISVHVVTRIHQRRREGESGPTHGVERVRKRQEPSLDVLDAVDDSGNALDALLDFGAVKAGALDFETGVVQQDCAGESPQGMSKV